MNHYDPFFGETFYNDSFHSNVSYEELLKNIKCETIFLKAVTNTGDAGLLMAALSEEDFNRVCSLIPNCKSVRFECGHGIHVEKEKEFIDCFLSL